MFSRDCSDDYIVGPIGYVNGISNRADQELLCSRGRSLTGSQRMYGLLLCLFVLVLRERVNGNKITRLVVDKTLCISIVRQQ